VIGSDALGPVVREATLADAGATGRIHCASWRAAYRGLLPDAFLGALDEAAFVERRRRDLASRRPGDRRGAWVVEAAGFVRGFAVAGPTRDRDLPRRAAEVYAIYLDPSWFGRGLGRPLMDRTLAHLRSVGFDRAALWVFRENRTACRFYEHAGFRLDVGAPPRVWRRGGIERPEVRYLRALR
jgi:GNAT superfamily N-acetyltransferase